ncbi:MAG: hypothetical protein ABSG76_23715 [Xanthobacteraceae bacterium]
MGSDRPYPWQPYSVDHILACTSLGKEDQIAILGATAARLVNIRM